MRDEEKTVVGQLTARWGFWDLIRRQLTHIHGSNAVEGQRMAVECSSNFSVSQGPRENKQTITMRRHGLQEEKLEHQEGEPP